MSEHTWAQKRIATYLAGKLKPADVERFEAHTRDCAQCEQAIEVAQLGKSLEGLFTEIRPAAGLEERAVVAFRKAPRPSILSRAAKKAMTGIAAILLLGVVGAMALDGPMKSAKESFSFVGSNIRDGDGSPEKARLRAETDQSPQAQGAVADGTYTGDIANNGSFPQSAPIGQQFQLTPNQLSQLTPGVPPTGGMAGMGGGMMGMSGGMMGRTGGSSSSASSSNGVVTGGIGGVPGGIGGGMGGISGAPGGFGGSGAGKPGFGLPGGSPGGGRQPQDFYMEVPPFSQPATPTATGVESKAFVKDSPTNFQPAAGKPTLPSYQPQGTPALNQEPTKTPPAPTKESKTETQQKDSGIIPNPEPTRRIVIRAGDIEFEIDSFDAATASITKLITEIKGAFIATVNSDKLPNGRVKGSITVRVPPEHLDSLVLDLRKELGKTGELKGVRITSQDVTKQYTDLESRLRGARTMEGRLIQIIKEGKGEIKQLLEAERELGIWRTKIEEFEGELRYYANLAALSSLTIALVEKEVRAAAVLTESERVQAGLEVEDVDKAYQQLLAAVVEAKGRVTKSDVKQYAAGQFNATLNFEVSPDASGPMRDRLRQLGRVARLEIDRGQHTEGGNVAADTKLKRGDTVFLVQLYNLANIAARETVTLQLAAPDVAIAYQALRDAIAKTTGRVVASQLNEQDKQNVTAQLDFEVRRQEEAVARTALEKAGEAISRQATRAPESDNVTDTKVLHRVTIVATSRVKARETKTLQVVAPDVSIAYRSIRDAVEKEKGRVITASLNEQDRQNVIALFEFEIPRASESVVVSALDAAGEAISRQVIRVPENENASDSKVHYQLTFSATSRLKPRETTSMTIEVANVNQAMATLAMEVVSVKAGRQLSGQSNQESSGKTIAKLSFEVPYSSAQELVGKFKSLGKVHIFQSKDDPQAPDGKFATARLEITLSDSEGIVPADDGLWMQVKKGLSYSVSALLKSVSWVVIGLCVVLPWAVIGFAGYRVVRRAVAPTSPPAPPAPPAPSSTPT